MKSNAAPNCDSPTAGLLSIAAAIARLQHSAAPVSEVEKVTLVDALGRVCADTLRSAIDIPPWPNSSVDGYAVRHVDLDQTKRMTLRVSQRIPAGIMGSPLEPGTAARIFTGAPLPDGADTVVMQEDCDESLGSVSVNSPVSLGDGVREAGEDIHRGDIVARAGQIIRAQDIGLAASIGIATLPVKRRLRVGLFATGDELAMPGQPLAPGQIYNTNLYLLWAALQKLGCEVISFGMVRDELNSTVHTLQNAATCCDLIISSGGVSVGEEDHVRTALLQLGELDFWRIAVKPGKPLAFGRIGGASFLGLPGNPVSAWVTFCLFAAPFIRLRQGADYAAPRAITAAARFSRTNRGVREEYVRARTLHDHSSGQQTQVEIHPNQSSGAFSSVPWSEGLVKIEADRTIKPGNEVEFYPYSEFGL